MTNSQEPGAELTFELQYVENMEQVTGEADTARAYVGSGEGTVSGVIDGTVRWDLFEAQGDVICDARFVGFIDTSSGDEIAFDAVGYLQRDDPESKDWRMAAGLRFETESDDFDWLNDVLATWSGTMDARSYTHEYQAAIQVERETEGVM